MPLFFCLKSLSLSQLIPANGLFNPVHKALKKLTDDLTAVYEDPGPVQTRKRSTFDKSS